MRRLICPQGDVRPDGNPHTIFGCGRAFEQSEESLADDPDGWADCPHCGLGFDPDDPSNQTNGVE